MGHVADRVAVPPAAWPVVSSNMERPRRPRLTRASGAHSARRLRLDTPRPQARPLT